MSNVILLKGDPIAKEYPLATSKDITPGMLCEITSTGYIQAHSTAGGNASPLFAQQQFSDPEKDIDDAYTVDAEQVHGILCRPGDEVYAWLADGQNVARSALLESNGAGALRAHTPPVISEDASGTDVFMRAPVVRAIEAVNNSAGGAIARIKVEVL